ALMRDYGTVRSAFESGDGAGARAQGAEVLAAGEHIRLLIRQLTRAELHGVEQATFMFRDEIADRQRLLLLILGVTSLIMVSFAYFTLRAVERPLHRLVAAANEFGAGNLQVSVNGAMPDEFRVLAGAFTG